MSQNCLQRKENILNFHHVTNPEIRQIGERPVRCQHIHRQVAVVVDDRQRFDSFKQLACQTALQQKFVRLGLIGVHGYHSSLRAYNTISRPIPKSAIAPYSLRRKSPPPANKFWSNTFRKP